MNYPAKWKSIEIIWITDINKIKINFYGIFMLKYWNCKSVLRDPTRIIGFIPDFRQFSLAIGPKKLLKSLRTWFTIISSTRLNESILALQQFLDTNALKFPVFYWNLQVLDFLPYYEQELWTISLLFNWFSLLMIQNEFIFEFQKYMVCCSIFYYFTVVILRFTTFYSHFSVLY